MNFIPPTGDTLFKNEFLLFSYLGARDNYQALSPFRDDSFRFYSISI